MADQPLAIVKLDPPHLDDAAGVLARAHFDSPVWPWMIPDEAHRRELLPWYMRLMLRHGLLAGETYTTAGAVRGVAMWEPPVRREAGPADPDIEEIWDGLPERMGPHGIARFRAMAEAQRPARERATPSGPVWQLPMLGVDPDAQRHGVGSALLAHMFARFDASREPVMLDTEAPANVPYYERHGFSVVASGTFPLDGPQFWLMLRLPRE